MNTMTGLNTRVRRILLALTAALAAFVGVWATVFPASFYDSFPGFGLHWISEDGAFSAHLILDVGALNLGFALAFVAAAVVRGAVAGRVVALGWTLFGVIHLGYHLANLDGSVFDRIGNVVTLGLDLALGVVLIVLPTRKAVAK